MTMLRLVVIVRAVEMKVKAREGCARSDGFRFDDRHRRNETHEVRNIRPMRLNLGGTQFKKTAQIRKWRHQPEAEEKKGSREAR